MDDKRKMDRGIDGWTDRWMMEGKISQEGAPKTVSLTLDILPSVSLLDFIYHFPLF